MKKKILFLLLLSLSSTLFAQINLDLVLKKRDSINNLNIGKEFPDFHAISLNSERKSGKELKGKITLINFWFRECAPCIAEFKALNLLYLKFKENPSFQFMSFTFDSPNDAKKTVDLHQLLYSVNSVSEEECRRLMLNGGFPTNIIIDQNGKISYFKTGGFLEEQKVIKALKPLEQKITELLSEIKPKDRFNE